MTVHRLDDYRPFDAGTPLRCYGCGTSRRVRQVLGAGGYVWACPDCPHPEDAATLPNGDNRCAQHDGPETPGGPNP